MNRRMINMAVMVVAVTMASLGTGILVQRAFTDSDIETVSTAKQGATNRIVVLQGYVFNYSPAENIFTFKDDTGTIELQTCPAWYRKVMLRNGEGATITGHVLPRKPAAPDAKYVMAVHTIDLKSGRRIVLRTTTGKPPWAQSINITTSNNGSK